MPTPSATTGTSHCGPTWWPSSKRSNGTWAPADQPHTPINAAQTLTCRDAGRPSKWTPVERHFRNGHTETWWAADARLGGYGPDSPCRLVVATTDPATLPEKATGYLAANLPHPAPHAATSPHPPHDLAEIVRLYGLRPWIGQSYKQIKDKLGWADFQVHSDCALRRHQTLVICAFSFCWDQWFAPPGPLDATAPGPLPRRPAREGAPPHPTSPNYPAGPRHYVPSEPAGNTVPRPDSPHACVRSSTRTAWLTTERGRSGRSGTEPHWSTPEGGTVPPLRPRCPGAVRWCA